MSGNAVQSLKAGAWISLVGVLLGLMAWVFEPHRVDIYGVSVPRLITAFLIPAVGLAVSVLLSLFIQCDPLIASHSSGSRAAVGGTITLPTVIALILHIVVLISGMAGHTLGSVSIVFMAGLMTIGIGTIFYSIEQNYVVGIRDIWTLRSPTVWERTHVLAWKLYVLSGLVLIVLGFVVPPGFSAFVTIIGMFLLPTLIAILYSYVIREDQYSYIVRG